MQAWPEDMQLQDPAGSLSWKTRTYDAAVTQPNKAVRYEHTKQKAQPQPHQPTFSNINSGTSF